MHVLPTMLDTFDFLKQFLEPFHLGLEFLDAIVNGRVGMNNFIPLDVIHTGDQESLYGILEPLEKVMIQLKIE